MAAPLDIQAKLDDFLASNAALQKYVSKLWYIPEGNPPPPEVTHTLRLQSVAAAERHLLIGVVPAKPEFAALLDALLSLIATQPNARA